MRALPQRQREVLALRYYLDLSEAEIADTLGISRGAVKSHASRGTAALRELLKGDAVVTDDDLRDLLTDAVADVEPAYRLGEIKARTHRPARRGWYAVGGAVLAAAAVVAAVNLGESDDGRRDNVPPASAGEHTAALYFVGDTPVGPRLYREFQKVSGGPVADLEAITTEHGPTDPDYNDACGRPACSPRSRCRTTSIEIGLGEWTGPDYDIDPDYVHALLQAVVYTAQAATGEAAAGAVHAGRSAHGRPVRHSPRRRTDRARPPERHPGPGQHQRPGRRRDRLR